MGKLSKNTQVILEGHTREHKDGRRHITLTASERTQLAEHRTVEDAVAFFLDLETDLSNKEIADRLGLSIQQLKRLTQTSEFTRIYEDTLAMLGHSPRLMATAQALPDLLPAAFRTLRRLVTNDNIRDDIALKAAERILAINKVGAERNDEDPRDLQKFLDLTGTKVDGNLNVLQFNMPPEYREMFKSAFGNVDVQTSETPQLIEGEIETPEEAIDVN